MQISSEIALRVCNTLGIDNGNVENVLLETAAELFKDKPYSI